MIYPYNRLGSTYHLHASVEIAVPRTGRIRVRLDDQERIVSPGEALVIFPGIPHSYDASEASEGMIMMFTEEMLPESERDWLEARPAEPVVCLSTADRDVAHCLRRLTEEGQTSEALIRAYLSLMFMRLLPELKPQPPSGPVKKDVLYQAMHYMSQNLAAPLNICGTARALGINSYYLSHVLNERLHMGFRAYLNALRIERARRYLRVSSRSIEDIAAACGFANLRTFDRVFFERCGCTPRDFRKAAMALRQEHMRQ